MTSAPPPQSPPLSDSPLFWLLLFGGAALFAVALIEPKFAQREARIERMYQARQKVAARSQAGEAGQGGTAAHDSARKAAAESDSPTPIVSLRSLMLLLATLLVAASLVHGFVRRPPSVEPQR